MTIQPPFVPNPMPEPPAPPEPSACCDSGCDPCIYDLHERAMARYRQALHEWHERHPETTPVPSPAE